MKKTVLIINGAVLSAFPPESAFFEQGIRISRVDISGLRAMTDWEGVELAILNQLEDTLEIQEAVDRVREHSSALIVHFAREDQEEQILHGLQAGIDRLLPTGLSERVTAAVLRALLRKVPQSAVVRAGPLEVDVQGYQVRAQGERILLTLTEFKILAFLAKNSARAVDREELRNSLSAGGYVMARRMVDYHILGLRKRLGRYGTMVKTVRGVGYRIG